MKIDQAIPAATLAATRASATSAPIPASRAPASISVANLASNSLSLSFLLCKSFLSDEVQMGKRRTFSVDCMTSPRFCKPLADFIKVDLSSGSCLGGVVEKVEVGKGPR
jgi:hypothetical protein